MAFSSRKSHLRCSSFGHCYSGSALIVFVLTGLVRSGGPRAQPIARPRFAEDILRLAARLDLLAQLRHQHAQVLRLVGAPPRPTPPAAAPCASARQFHIANEVQHQVELLRRRVKSTSRTSTWCRSTSMRKSPSSIRLACTSLKLFKIAAGELGVGEDQLSAQNRKIFVTNDPEKSMSISKAVRIGLSRNESISGEGAYWPNVDSKREWVKNPYGQLSETFSFGTVIVEVKIDPETGQVEVVEAWAAQDVGYALNPKVIEGQFEGGFAMGGQGGMLTEFLQWHEGRVLTPTQLNYLVPLAIDMPKINNIIIETIDPNGPYGAKEAGMSVAMSAAQAYCGAISNALGVYFHDYPITPDKILNAIEKKK